MRHLLRTSATAGLRSLILTACVLGAAARFSYADGPNNDGQSTDNSSQTNDASNNSDNNNQQQGQDNSSQQNSDNDAQMAAAAAAAAQEQAAQQAAQQQANDNAAAAGENTPPPQPGAGATASPGDSVASASTMRFETYVLQDDPNYTGEEVAHCLIPAGWKVNGGMEWDLSNSFPAQVHMQVYDPNGPGSFYIYPNLDFYWSRENSAFPAGTRYGGALVQSPPVDPFEAARTVLIPTFRPELQNAVVLETERLPKWSQLISDQTPIKSDHQLLVAAGRIRFEYQVNGQPVQEDLYLVFEQNINQRLGYEGWHIRYATSVRAPVGQLARMREMHDVLMRSCVPNLNWFNMYTQFEASRFNRNTLDSLRATEAVREQAKQAAQIDDVTRQSYESLQKSNDGMVEARAETLRGETAWKDSDGSKVLLPSEYGRAWRDDTGQYIVSNDSGYNPNSDSDLHSTWTAMDRAQ